MFEREWEVFEGKEREKSNYFIISKVKLKKILLSWSFKQNTNENSVARKHGHYYPFF